MSGDPRSDIGPIGEYAEDLVKWPPGKLRPEQLSFTVTIENGVEIDRTSSRAVDMGFAFALRRIKGWISDPSNNGALAHLVEFNIVDEGRSRPGLFRDPVNMASVASPAGPAHDLIWDGFYLFRPRADLAVNWSIDLTGFPGVGTHVFGVSLTGDLVRAEAEPRSGALIIPTNG